MRNVGGTWGAGQRAHPPPQQVAPHPHHHHLCTGQQPRGVFTETCIVHGATMFLFLSPHAQRYLVPMLWLRPQALPGGYPMPATFNPVRSGIHTIPICGAAPLHLPGSGTNLHGTRSITKFASGTSRYGHDVADTHKRITGPHNLPASPCVHPLRTKHVRNPHLTTDPCNML